MNEFKDAVADAEGLVTDAAHSASREYAMARRNIQGAFDEAISRLDPRERHILALRFCQGKTQMEVSSEIGISQAQVSRLEKGAINSIRRNM